MLKDPRSSFFEALCIGFDWYENPTTETSLGTRFPPEYTRIRYIYLTCSFIGHIPICETGNNWGQASGSRAEPVVATTANEAGNNNQRCSISLTEQVSWGWSFYLFIEDDSN